MFSQELGSSPDNTVRKLGAMFLSLCSHIFVLALMVGLSLFVSKVVLVEADGPGLSRLTFGPPPGDPRQLQPDTMHAPHFGIVRIDPKTNSKIHMEELKRGDVADILPILAPLGPVPFGFKIWTGPCGCRPGPYTPVHSNPATPPRPPSWRQQAILVKKVDPEYPLFARRAGIHGAVVLHATIDREGRIAGLSVVSGPNQLRQAALDAVRQWRYQPYVLNGLAVDIQTTITLNFVLLDAVGTNPSRIL